MCMYIFDIDYIHTIDTLTRYLKGVIIINDINKYNIILMLNSICFFCLGDLTIQLKVLLITMLLDYVSGVISAIYNKKLSSKVGFKGILKKIMLLIGVSFSYYMDVLLKQDIFKNLTILLFLSNEGISIIENLGKCGVKLPKQVQDFIRRLKNGK